MSNDSDEAAAAGIELTKPRRLGRGVAAVCRWIGWWMTTGMLVLVGGVSIAAIVRSRTLDFQGVTTLASMATAGVALGALLWRRRRGTDGAVAAMILTTGFWVAVWVLAWTLPGD
jgi:hypothetical protein